jgi:hypothetical protein
MAITFRTNCSMRDGAFRATEQLRGTDHDQDNIWMFERR